MRLPEPKPRTTLEVGETATGEIAAGPSNYWRIPLDKVDLSRTGDLIEARGKETRIVVSAPTIDECIEGFWEGFCDLWKATLQGFAPQDLTDYEQDAYRAAIKKRFLRTIASPPSDGEPYELNAEFWDGATPPEKNPCPVVFSVDPGF